VERRRGRGNGEVECEKTVRFKKFWKLRNASWLANPGKPAKSPTIKGHEVKNR